MLSICGTGCCGACDRRADCGGCAETGGHPFGGSCAAAECIRRGGPEAFADMKKALIGEINGLGIPGLRVEDLNLLNGFYVNLPFPLPNGQSVRLLADDRVYLGNQVEIPGSGRCYGVAADEQSLLVCEYGRDGADPQILVYKRRQAGSGAF